MLFRDTPTGKSFYIYIYMYGLASVGCVGNSAASSQMPASKISGVGWIWLCSLREMEMTQGQRLSAGKRDQALFRQR